MERVHEPNGRPWIGELMNVREFKQRWTDRPVASELANNAISHRRKIMELMSIPESVAIALEEDCG